MSKIFYNVLLSEHYFIIFERLRHKTHCMIKLIIVPFLLCATIYCNAQVTHVKPSKSQRDSLRNELEAMLANDQKYRWMIMYGELDEKKLAEYKQMDEAQKFKRMTDVQDGKVGITQAQKDSLWRLQSPIDSRNFITVMAITKRFGFPNKYIEPYKVSTMIQHSPQMMNDKIFNELMGEVDNGNLPGFEYANIYDTYRMGKHLPPLYYTEEAFDEVAGESKDVIPANIDETNKARKAIGLKPLKVAH